MLKILQTIFQKTDQQASDTQKLDVKLAAATLMFELIRSDGRIEELERSHMTELLHEQFGLSGEDLESLYELAEENAKQAISLHQFTQEICAQWGNEKRLQLLENLWLLALSDDFIDPHERHLVRKVAGLLYINDQEITLTRERAKRKLAAKNQI